MAQFFETKLKLKIVKNCESMRNVEAMLSIIVIRKVCYIRTEHNNE